MPLWLILVLAVAVLAFWVLLAFVVAVVIGGAFRAGLRNRPRADVAQPDADPTIDDNRTVT